MFLRLHVRLFAGNSKRCGRISNNFCRGGIVTNSNWLDPDHGADGYSNF